MDRTLTTMFGKEKRTELRTGAREERDLVVTEDDVELCAQLVLAFADGADSDSATRLSARAIASAGSGVFPVGEVALRQAMATDGRAWRWLAACAAAASPRTHALLPLGGRDGLDPNDRSAPNSRRRQRHRLLGAPSDVFSLIKDIAARSAGGVDAAQPLWPPEVDPGSMTVAEALRGSAA
jgi:hypothetical protein